MSDHAFFLSLTDNYAYLFNALLNSIEVFGAGSYAEVVAIHDGSLSDGYMSLVESAFSNLKTKVKFVPILVSPEDKDLGKAMTVKFYRYKAMAEMGQDYKSICFIDTDIFLASDVKEFFDIAAATDLTVAVKDNVIRHYKSDAGVGTCPAWENGRKPYFQSELWDAKFICNTPLWIDARKHGEVLIDVWAHRKKLGMDNTWPFNGDLETMNLVFDKHGLKRRMLVMPSHLWTGVHYSIYRTTTLVRRASVGDNVGLTDESFRRKILFLADNQDQIRSFHGRDWVCDANEARLKTHNVPKLLSQMEGKFEGPSLDQAVARRARTFDDIQAYFLWLQFDCHLSIEEVEKVASVKDMAYLRRRRQELDQTIRSFDSP